MEISKHNEPPVGTWVKDRFGAVSFHQVDGWGLPGCWPTGKWEMMWDARGPYTLCGVWGKELPTLRTKLIQLLADYDLDENQFRIAIQDLIDEEEA